MKIDLHLLSLAGITILMWGLWGFFGKLAIMKNMAPTSMLLLETLIGVLCALPLVLVQSRLTPHTTWNLYGVLSGLGLALGLICYYLALQRAQASLIIPLTATYPLISVLLSTAFLRERLALPQLAGALLVVTGTILLLIHPTEIH